mmetsp:Transcript_46389/g.105219  ORF Transcript_46389/g.105219 Transcript_46389/m.105219 type:complete len:449 (+) Transcript_46389:1749-3095(+)
MEQKIKRDKVEKEKEQRQQMLVDLFSKYDVDSSSRLEAEEVVMMALHEFQLELSSEEAARMVKQLDPDKIGGIHFTKMGQLQNKLRVISDIQKTKARREREEQARQEKERRLLEQRGAAEQKLEGHSALFVDADTQLAEVEQSARLLKAKAAHPDFKLVRAQEVEDKLPSLQEAISQVRGELKGTIEECNADDIGGVLERKGDVTKMQTRVSVLQSRLGALQRLVVLAREDVSQRELDKSRRVLAKAKRLLGALLEIPGHEIQLHLQFATDAYLAASADPQVDQEGLEEVTRILAAVQIRAVGGGIKKLLFETAKKISDFLPTLEVVGVNAEEFDAFCVEHLQLPKDASWAAFDSAKEGDVLKSINELTKTRYEVVTETMLFTALAFNEGKKVRKLQVGEKFEGRGVPVEEPHIKTPRVFGVAESDGAQGWVTITGNQGTAFLEELPE